MNRSLNPPNRRIRDPYVRWCGRRGVARFLPIPIIRARLGLARFGGAFRAVGSLRLVPRLAPSVRRRYLTTVAVDLAP